MRNVQQWLLAKRQRPISKTGQNSPKLLPLITAISLIFAGSAYGHGDVDNDNQRYQVGETQLWFKDDTRAFDPRLDWYCSNANFVGAINSVFGPYTCNSGVITPPRGLRTIPLRILYPVAKQDAKGVPKINITDMFYEGSLADCKTRVNTATPPSPGTNTIFNFLQIGFGFEYTFTSQTPEGFGNLSALFNPASYIDDQMITKHCLSNNGELKDAKPAKGNFPVITISHGNDFPDFNEKEWLNLVKDGYIVLIPSHVGDGYAFMPPASVLGNRVTQDIAAKISATGLYPTQQLNFGSPDPGAEQDIKVRVDDLLATIAFAKELNATGQPSTLLKARDIRTLQRLKGSLAMTKLGFGGSSNGGETGRAMLVKPAIASQYKAAFINVSSQWSTPLQDKISGTYLQAVFGRNDILRSDGYVYNADATSDAITHTVPMLTYLGVEDDIFPLIEWCSAIALCTWSAPGNTRFANIPTRSNLHPLHVNGVVMGASGPQYLLNINNVDHAGILLKDKLTDIPAVKAIYPLTYKESIWDNAGDFLFLGTDPAAHGGTSRYALLDENLRLGLGKLFTRTWMDLYLKNKLCSNTKDVKIYNDANQVVVTIPKSWNNLKILKSWSVLTPAGVDSAVYNNLLVGLKIPPKKGAPEDIACPPNDHHGDDDDDEDFN